MDSKVCTNCKLEKDLIDFHKHKRYKFGVKAQCKDCEKQYAIKNKNRIVQWSKEYRKKNSEKLSEISKQYREKNKELLSEKRNKYYKNNKEIFSENRKEYYKNNKEKISEKAKEKYENNKEKIKERVKIYYENNKEKRKEKAKEYRENNKEKIKDREEKNKKIIQENPNLIKKCIKCEIEKQINQFNKAKLGKYGVKSKCKSCFKEYRENNKEKRNEYERLRKGNDSLYKLTCNIRTLILGAIKKRGYKKNTKTANILGCDYETFKNYIESKFEPWMDWSKHGLYNGELNYGFDLDHIIPISSAKTEENIIKLNHYTNFQPLCSKVNREIKRELL